MAKYKTKNQIHLLRIWLKSKYEDLKYAYLII